MEKALTIEGTRMEFSPAAHAIVKKARKLSISYGHIRTPVKYESTLLAFIALRHPLYLLLRNRFSLSTPILKNLLYDHLLKYGEDKPSDTNWRKEHDFFQHAEAEARAAGSAAIREEHLFAVIFKCRDSFNSVLWTFENQFGVKQEHLLKFVQDLAHVDAFKEIHPMQDKTPLGKAEPVVVPSGRPFPKCSDESLLARFGRNLNELAREGKGADVVAREKEINTVQEILARRDQNNVILVGHAGVGKGAIVEGLAGRIVRGNIPKRLQDKVIIEINLASLISGTTLRGQFEERIQNIIKECEADESVILFFPDIHQIMSSGGLKSSDAAHLLKPALMKGSLRCIGTATVADYYKFIEPESALARGFQVVRVEEPSRLLTLEMLKKTLNRYTQFHQVSIDENTLQTLIELSDRYIKDRHLPGKAISLLDWAASRVSLSSAPEKKITKDIIAQIISEKIGIPVNQILFSKEDIFLNLEEKLKERVIGQERVIRRMADVIQLTKYEMDLKPERPDGVFLIAGPTGTGKTELAKTLAEVLLGSEQELLRFDMSEFMEKHNVSKLIGSPPGYQGSEEGGMLTNAVKANPYSVILFDEIEKAHADIAKLFLQIFDDGRLTDAKGLTVSFSFTTIIMTSNLGARELNQEEVNRLPFARRPVYIQSKMEPEIKAHFAPEFLNRIDDILYFNFLSEETVQQITKSKIKEVLTRFEAKGRQIIVSEAVYAYLIGKGYSMEYGGRFLNRTIEEVLLKPLAKFALTHPDARSIRCDMTPADCEVRCSEGR